MAALTVHSLSHKVPMAMPAGEAADPTNGDTVANNGNTVLIVNNTDGAASHTVTVNLARTVDGQAATPLTWTLAAGAERVAALGPATFYGSNVSLEADSALVTYRCLRP